MHIIIDTSWVLYRGYFSSKHIWEHFPELHFFCKLLNSYLNNKDNIIHLCIDGWNTKGKNLLNDNYKAGRKKEDSYNVYAGLSTFVSLLDNNRIKIYYNKDYEADEIIYTLSHTLDGKKKILSADKDLLQALSADISIENGSKFVITNESYKYDYYDKFFGIEPNKLPLLRAIIGDISDSLKPPVPRFPHKLAAKIVQNIDYNGTMPSKQQLSNLKIELSDTETKWFSKLLDAYDKFNINFQIMKLNIINDNLHEEYNSKQIDIDNFLKSKILNLNTL